MATLAADLRVVHAPEQGGKTDAFVTVPMRPRRRETPWGMVLLWLCTALIGSILAVIGFLGVVDPVGSKQADDSDPFGPPGGRAYPALLMLIGVSLVLWPLVPRLSGAKGESARVDSDDTRETASAVKR